MRSNSSNNVIEIHGLTKRFGSFTAVDHVSLQIPQGQIFGFLGPNGAGKTTTMRMVLGLLPPSEGTAIVLGNDIRKQARTIRARLGYMSQKFTLYNDLTVEENLRFYGRSYGLRNNKLKSRLDYVLDIADLKGREHYTPTQLSGGWRQRLALGAAIIHEPDIIFLDEPTAGVDPLSRRAFWELLYTISSAGTTIFITTHYMDEAEHCEQLGFIYFGRLIATGSPTEIKQKHVPGNVVQFTPEYPVKTLQVLRTAQQQGELENTSNIDLYGAQIHVLTHNGDMIRDHITALLDQQEQPYTDMQVIPPSLEDAFLRLTAAQK